MLMCHITNLEAKMLDVIHVSLYQTKLLYSLTTSHVQHIWDLIV